MDHITITENPLISVIIPVYNGEQYVKACLENILSQSYKNIEIIVVNDGSQDRSAAIAASYPIRLINHDQNRGLSAARNTGIDHAQGAYIHFMDVDDGINLDYYKNLARAIVPAGADIACGGMVHEHYRYKTQRFKKELIYSGNEEKLRVTFVGKWGYVWRYLFRTEYLRERQLRFEEGRFIEDMMFSIPAVYYANKVVVVPETEYYYYHRENSIMTNRDKSHREKRRRDKAHADAFRKDFARQHNIKIPWVDKGRIAYILRKLSR